MVAEHRKSTEFPLKRSPPNKAMKPDNLQPGFLNSVNILSPENPAVRCGLSWR